MMKEGTVRIEVVEGQVAPRPRKIGDEEIISLTERQWKAFIFIAEAITDRGHRPTYRDVTKHCEYADATGGRAVVLALSRIGLVRTSPNQARSVSLTEDGESFYNGWAAAGKKKVKPKRRKNGRKH